MMMMMIRVTNISGEKIQGLFKDFHTPSQPFSKPIPPQFSPCDTAFRTSIF